MHNFYVIKLKRNFLPLAFLCFTFGLLIFSKSNLPAVKSGLALWANSVVPSLFPFFVATELIFVEKVLLLLLWALLVVTQWVQKLLVVLG